MDQIMPHEGSANEAVDVGLDASFIGAPFKVRLVNGYEIKSDAVSGKTSVSIVDLPGLIAAIVRSRVLLPKKLTADDLRFIRSALSFKSVEVAEILDVTPEHYSRCENGTRTLSPAQEKCYRMTAFLCMCATDVTIKKSIDDRLTQDANPDLIKKSVDVFKKIFLEMKINAVSKIDEEVVIVLGRRSGKDCKEPCEDNGDWSDSAQVAA